MTRREASALFSSITLRMAPRARFALDARSFDNWILCFISRWVARLILACSCWLLLAVFVTAAILPRIILSVRLIKVLVRISPTLAAAFALASSRRAALRAALRSLTVLAKRLSVSAAALASLVL